MPRSTSLVLRSALLATAILLCTSSSWAALRVSPGVIEGRFDNGRMSGAFTITSTNPKAVRVRAFPTHFRLSQTGELAPVAADSNSLADWMKITPREFTLEPNSERQVRYVIIAPDTVPAGSYWGAIQFMPLPSHQDSIDAQTSIRAIAIVVVPIMVDKGKPSYHWDLNPDSIRSVVTSDGVVILSKVENNGTGRIPQKGRYEVRDKTGSVVHSGETERLSVLPHSERLLATTLPKTLAAGQYEYLVTYTSEVDGSKLTGAYRFDVPAKYPDPPTPKKR